MTSLLITAFCLGCCVGMIFTIAICKYLDSKHKRR